MFSINTYLFKHVPVQVLNGLPVFTVETTADENNPTGLRFRHSGHLSWEVELHFIRGYPRICAGWKNVAGRTLVPMIFKVDFYKVIDMEFLL